MIEQLRDKLVEIALQRQEDFGAGGQVSS